MLRSMLCAGLVALTSFAGVPAVAQHATSSVPASTQSMWTGAWQGTLEAGQRRLRLQLTITAAADGSLSGQLESLDQAPGQPMPITTMSVIDGRLSFAIPAKRISYEGVWTPEANSFVGAFRQGASMPLTLVRGGLAPASVVEGLDGVWSGTTRRNGADMRMALRVATGPAGTEAKFDAPDMFAMGMPVTALTRQGDQVRFTLPTAGVSFTGQISGRSLSGGWTDGSTSLFQRADAEALTTAARRPQTPQPPFPYREIETHISNAGAPDVTLAATLTLPAGDGPFPAVVLITGSGPQDRDETAYGHKPFAVLADHLARRGVAVLRYDDRGVGGSTGRHLGATSADFAADAKAAVAWIASRPEIDARAIGLLGHSEGGMIAPLTAMEAPSLSYLVLLAAPGVRIADLLDAQRRALADAQGRSAAEIAASDTLQTRLTEIAGGSMDRASAETALQVVLNDTRITGADLSPAARDAIREQVLDPWFRWFIRHDPSPALAHFRGPILALNGSLDRQVLPDQNLSGIRNATVANADVTIIELPGLNHLFQTARTGGLGEYAAIEETMSPAALDAVSAWIVERYVRGDVAKASGASR